MTSRILTVSVTVLIASACTYFLDSPNLAIIAVLVGCGTTVVHKNRRIR